MRNKNDVRNLVPLSIPLKLRLTRISTYLGGAVIYEPVDAGRNARARCVRLPQSIKPRHVDCDRQAT